MEAKPKRFPTTPYNMGHLVWFKTFSLLSFKINLTIDLLEESLNLFINWWEYFPPFHIAN
jgi:hypothetical protein